MHIPITPFLSARRRRPLPFDDELNADEMDTGAPVRPRIFPPVDERTPPFNPSTTGGREMLDPLRPPALMRPSKPPPLYTPDLPEMEAPDLAPRYGTSPGDYRGEPINDPVDFRRDQYVRQGEIRVPVRPAVPPGEDGAPPTPPLTQGTGKYKRSFGDILKTGLLGAAEALGSGDSRDPNLWARALGGFATGAVGAGVSPKAGREYRFRAMYEPGLRAEQEREQQRTEQERQRQIDDLRRRQAETGMRRTELEMKEYPEDQRLRQAEREAQIEELKARAEQRLHPPPRPGSYYIDADGFRRDAATDKRVHDPETGQPIKGLLTRTQRGESAPSWAVGRDRETGELVDYDRNDPEQVARVTPYRAQAGRPEQAPTEAAQAHRQVMQLKAAADAAFADFGQNPDYPEKKAAAYKALAEYNSFAKQLGEQFSDYYEAGEGDKGWWYVKPRAQAAQLGQPQPSGGASTTTRPVGQIQGNPKYPGWTPLK